MSSKKKDERESWVVPYDLGLEPEGVEGVDIFSQGAVSDSKTLNKEIRSFQKKLIGKRAFWEEEVSE